MRVIPLTLVAILSLSLSIGRSAFASSELAEWELFKAYLMEVEKRTALEIELERSHYKLSEMIFHENNRRWWELYREDQRKQKINEYWQKYRAGASYAQELVAHNNVGNHCKLLNQVDLTNLASPVEDEVMATAFIKGFKSAYPECSIPNLDQFLKETDKKISAVEGKLKSLQIAILTSKPNEAETEIIYGQLKDKYVAAVKNHLNVSRENLQKSFVLSETELNRLKEGAKILGDAINCKNLRSRAGTRYNCTVEVLTASHKLGLASTYRVLRGEQDTGVFQPRLFLGQLFTAAAVHLKEVNPNDQVVRYLINDLNISLHNLQKSADKKIEDARKLIAEDFFKQMLTLKIDTIDLNRGILSKEVMMGIVTDLLDIKPRVEAYARFDLSTHLEEEILGIVLAHYRNTIGLAASLKAEIELPKRNIVITLEDEESSDVVTLGTMPIPPKAYLLGLSTEDVREWMKILAM